MKKILTLCLVAGLTLAATGAYAIDFNAKGRWEMMFNAGEHSFLQKNYGNKAYPADVFEASQRLRLQMDAVASESLSGTVMFEIGSIDWGQGSSGGALGADGTIVEVKRAYLDWVVPSTDLKIRMGIQGVELPNAAGGSTIMNDEVAGITASYKFNDTVSLTALWMRPYNDNYTKGGSIGGVPSNSPSNFLDNMDLVSLILPLTFDGIKVTPWLMYGAMGKNVSFDQLNSGNLGSRMFAQQGLFPRTLYSNSGNRLPSVHASRAYGDIWFAGIPVKLTMFDPINIEFDANYGYSQGWGDYTDASGRRASMKREGFVLKALAEYKMDWGTPGIFGWYGSGDDGNNRNGSESMPSLSPLATFSTFGMGAYGVEYANLMSGEVATRTYAGSWGLGLQLKDISFVENLNHTVRALYYRGTNDPAMAKELGPMGWNSYAAKGDEPAGWGLYLTQNDYLVEFNIDTTWKIYDNLDAILELAYIVNGVDKDTWKWQGNQKADAWKTGVSFVYNF